MLLLGGQWTWAQNNNDTYPETKQWLLQMKDHLPSKELENLFEQADSRMPDLIRALDESPKEISINAQKIILYLANPDGLKALQEWKQNPKKSGQLFWAPKMGLLPESKLLNGIETNLIKLVLKNRQLLQAGAFNSGKLSVTVIARNKQEKAVLIEVIEGQTFTSGWHIVIKQKEGKWHLISDNNIWVH